MHGHWLKDYIGPKASAQGGGGTAPLICTYLNNAEHLDKTVGEIVEAFEAGRAVLMKHNIESYEDPTYSIGALQSLDINSDEDNSWQVSFNFTGANLITSPGTRGEVYASYPYYSD